MSSAVLVHRNGVVKRLQIAADHARFAAAAGGRYVVRSQSPIGLDGTPPQRFVLIAFDSPEKAMAWSNSPATKEVTAARIKTTDSLSFMVEGFAN
jgi:uncharacterized protein (DUF1330 family)